MLMVLAPHMRAYVHLPLRRRSYHKLTLTLLKASWRRSQKLIAERRTAIIKVAEVMLQAEDERISGALCAHASADMLACWHACTTCNSGGGCNDDEAGGG